MFLRIWGNIALCFFLICVSFKKDIVTLEQSKYPLQGTHCSVAKPNRTESGQFPKVIAASYS